MEFKIVKNSRTKRLRIRVLNDGSVVVSGPKSISKAVCESFVMEHRSWIEAALQKVSAQKERLNNEMQDMHDKIRYLGKVYNLEIDGKIKKPYTVENEKITLKTEDRTKFYRSEAKRIIEAKCMEIAPYYGAEIKKIRVAFQKSRWGSCSSRGTLSFNANLIKAPQSIIEYVIIHEICHTVHLNHSQDYWNEVAKLCPDYLTRRNWLKKEGYLLNI